MSADIEECPCTNMYNCFCLWLSNIFTTDALGRSGFGVWRPRGSCSRCVFAPLAPRAYHPKPTLVPNVTLALTRRRRSPSGLGPHEHAAALQARNEAALGPGHAGDDAGSLEARLERAVHGVPDGRGASRSERDKLAARGPRGVGPGGGGAAGHAKAVHHRIHANVDHCGFAGAGDDSEEGVCGAHLDGVGRAGEDLGRLEARADAASDVPEAHLAIPVRRERKRP
mmetsp:Transcript_16628/g.51068  ORF Transcript_16628/g.51068 Transcript_16628/m.51068 type:complete len:226 (+) Transcript_16628:144-821(+)